MPKSKASVTDRGIIFRDLYYTCKKAETERWFDRAKIDGRWTIPITYDPTCLNNIYFTAEDGALVKCELLTRSSVYEDLSVEDMNDIKDSDSQERAEWSQEQEKARTGLILELETLVQRCKKEKNDSVDAVGNVLDKHKLRNQREKEKEEQSGKTVAQNEQKNRNAYSTDSATTCSAPGDADNATPTDKTFKTAKEAVDHDIDEALRTLGL